MEDKRRSVQFSRSYSIIRSPTLADFRMTNALLAIFPFTSIVPLSYVL